MVIKNKDTKMYCKIVSTIIMLFTLTIFIRPQERQFNYFTQSNVPDTVNLELEENFILKFSSSLEPIEKDRCNQIIANAPKKIGKITSLLFDPNVQNAIKFHNFVFLGDNQSYNLTLCRVIAQSMNMPFILVNGNALAQRKISFARISSLSTALKANIIIHDIEKISSSTAENGDNQLDIPGAFCDTIDILERNELMLFCDTKEFYNVPERLRQRIRGSIYTT